MEISYIIFYYILLYYSYKVVYYSYKQYHVIGNKDNMGKYGK